MIFSRRLFSSLAIGTLLLVLPVCAETLSTPAKMPALNGATAWINSKPLTAKDLRGKVVLVDFWTYSCINCLRTLPAMRAWNERYKGGLVIVGVHTPEFSFEADPAKVERAVKRFGITYPVALDGKRAIWSAFANRYWPAHYLVDAEGRIRYHHFGEGGEAEEEQWIQKLLAESKRPAAPKPHVQEKIAPVEVAADFNSVDSPETYLGSWRAERFVSPGGLARDAGRKYTAPEKLEKNQWALTGRWRDQVQSALLEGPEGSLLFRFHARDLHLVLGAGKSAKPIRFRVLLDGHAPGADHGADIDAQGYGTVTEERLYQLVRQHGAIRDRNFEIQFLDSGVEAFSFTFG